MPNARSVTSGTAGALRPSREATCGHPRRAVALVDQPEAAVPASRIKPWLRQRLKELRLRHGTLALPERELARRAGLHVEELRRWLYADHLPSSVSGPRFGRLLAAIGADAAEQGEILARLGLPPLEADDPLAWLQECRLLFNRESAAGRWEIAEWLSPAAARPVLRRPPHAAWDPAIGPDGRLSVSVERGAGEERRVELWRPDGAEFVFARALPLPAAARAAWSPDGRSLCCQVDLTPGRGLLVRHDPDSGATVRLTSGQHRDAWPAWRPDGSTIVFQRDAELWAVDAAGAHTWRLLDREQSEGCQVWAPAFSPDGTRLAFVRGAGRRTSDLCLLDLQSHTLTTLLHTPGVEHLDPCWSPDGNWLLYASDAGPRRSVELWMVAAVGGPGRQLSDYGGAAFRPEVVVPRSVAVT